MTDNESILSAESILFVMTTANQRAAKRDGIRIERELACSIIATRKLPVADPVASDILRNMKNRL